MQSSLLAPLCELIQASRFKLVRREILLKGVHGAPAWDHPMDVMQSPPGGYISSGDSLQDYIHDISLTLVKVLNDTRQLDYKLGIICATSGSHSVWHKHWSKTHQNCYGAQLDSAISTRGKDLWFTILQRHVPQGCEHFVVSSTVTPMVTYYSLKGWSKL